MKRCPITYEEIKEKANYAKRGLNLLSPQLKTLHSLKLTALEQRMAAIQYSGKMSIGGSKTKLSANLKIQDKSFELVSQFGRYILKPQSNDYPELPENEALTMSLAEMIGINVPVHGLVYSEDNSMTYFVRRFDRVGHNKKLPTEDVAQLLGLDRTSKYEGTMEQVANIIETYCSFPKVEFATLLKLTLFNFLVGHYEMHLKKFSLITEGKRTMMSPAYGLLNTTIIKEAENEIALSIGGKRSDLTREDFIDNFAIKILKLNQKAIDTILKEFNQVIPEWKAMIKKSFLTKTLQQDYLDLLAKRCKRLALSSK